MAGGEKSRIGRVVAQGLDELSKKIQSGELNVDLSDPDEVEELLEEFPEIRAVVSPAGNKNCGNRACCKPRLA
jgi:hypothetical protein